MFKIVLRIFIKMVNMYFYFKLYYLGSLVGSFSVRQVSGVSSIEPYIEMPNCNSDFHKKCIKQKSKVIFFIHNYFSIIFQKLIS